MGNHPHPPLSLKGEGDEGNSPLPAGERAGVRGDVTHAHFLPLPTRVGKIKWGWVSNYCQGAGLSSGAGVKSTPGAGGDSIVIPLYPVKVK